MEKLSLSDWFKEFSYDTWNRLEFTRKTKSIKTSEVTITQNLIYNCYLLSRQFDLPIRVYEAIDESINGNDIEFAVETSKGYVLFPTQAKIIKNNDKYDTISHRVNKKYQIELLEEYGNKIRGIPLYLFYNNVDTHENEERIDSFSDPTELAVYGCSISKLSFLKNYLSNKKWVIPSFWDIHPKNGFPLHKLIEIAGKNIEDIDLIRGKFEAIKFYEKKEMIDIFDGVNLSPRPKIGFIPSSDKQKKTISNLSGETYRPRFRVVISNESDFNKFQIKILTTEKILEVPGRGELGTILEEE